MGITTYEHLWGGCLVGGVISTILGGILTVQCDRYFSTFHSDPVGTRMTVALVCLLQLIHITCHPYYIFTEIIENLGVSLTTTLLRPMLHFSSLASTATVQLFFIYRLQRTNKSALLTLALIVLALSQFGAAVNVFSIQLRTVGDMAMQETTLRSLYLSWLGIEILLDTIIAAMMSLSLRRYQTGFRQTNAIINSLTFYAIGTGVFTSVVAIVILLVFTINGLHWTLHGFCLPTSGIYSVSLLVNLQSRTHIKQHTQRAESIHLSRLPKHVQVRLPGLPH
ncbi:uncharacterized protein EI90DRAFT_449653 [Cantharellus anzutake]|uniref:uncharacterized protein n=1 Tax=Cantharellus anzutake TaxID=1750568 RepID=UPI0019053CF9|nr:uncharacterized protein EI90DRAFT_449653 [Cantharellus anzutake]KAF8334663.1 hypothetical protein EI90DRAFT_449653 [Cantharellus anzutake]